MKPKITLIKIAEHAGLSLATVDRVLNSRLPVREVTARQVIAAAESLGYHAAELMRERQKERVPVRNLGFCLQKRSDPFYQTLGLALQKAAANNRPETCVAHIAYMDALEPAAIAEQLLAMGKTADALAVVAVDHPHVTSAIAALQIAGKPCFTLLSDLSAPQRAGYIGLDSRQCGRTAAWAISRLSKRAGEVGVFVGSHRYLGHELAEISFRSYLREYAPQFRVLDSLVNLEDAQLAHEATLELLARHPDLVGIYVAGGGMPGIVRALRAEGIDRDIVVVGNELTADNRDALIDGIVDLVIQTPLEKLTETTVTHMLSALADGKTPSSPTQHLLPMEIFTPENFSSA